MVLFVIGVFTKIYTNPHTLTSSSSNASNGIFISNPSYELARRQSYGFFHQIPEEEWNIKQEIVRDYIPHKFPNNPLALNPEAEEEMNIVENVPRVRKRAFHYIEMDLPIRYVSWYQNVSVFCVQCTLYLYIKRYYV